ncbi:MAG: hypothetical protein EA401_00220 [Planctomycetota bacterium]|nr:MAG: hypothetical protein EA401_00220 [Planctomycetota bacterium]
MPSSKRSTRNGNRPTTRRRLAAVEDHRPVAADGSQPPLLDLGLKYKIKVLALANVIPIGLGLLLFIGWMTDRVQFSIDEHRLLFTVLIMLCCLVAIALSWWVINPLSQWLYRYCLWYYRHDSPMIWSLPLAATWLLWLGMWILCIVLTISSVWLLGAGAWSLIARM